MEEDKNKHVLKKQRTRKLNCPFAVNLLQENLHTGVPFSWDRIPGQPLPEYVETNNTGNTYQTPPTPPPSIRWQPLPNCVAEGLGVSEGIDIFSLAETTDGLVENCKICSTEELDDANQSPDFIIRRFLPDAQALAAASLAQKKVLFSSPSSDASFSRPVGGSCAKGCGFRCLYHSLVKPRSRTPPGASKSDSTSHSTNKQKKN
ncbi:hypothetical protein F511_30221 [Dorcoceras hygrometricum]|uniref:Uncharacterized protein n=1 Tax=Dorcoceras hygrometricum TaxID=472368 RepID=A0A2Z7A890_9LAMI|nr:hypothetical protein F511_30221 [Dorcoceras hygrometricum]